MKTAGWYARLVVLPVVIDEPGLYRTRSGEDVVVTTASMRNRHACHGRYSCGIPESWHRSGRLYFGQLSGNDIVAKSSKGDPSCPN